jgi:hypothetical protein
MKRATWGVCAFAVAAVGVTATASNSVPNSTASYTNVRVAGASLRTISYNVAGSSITGFTANLRGNQVLRTASASFNGGLVLPCIMGLYNLGADQTPLTCTGFAQPAATSWRLVVTVN